MCGSWVSNVTVAQWQCPLWTPNVPPMRRSTERCAGTSLSRKRITPEEESCFSSIIFQLSSLLEYCKTPVIKKPYIYIYIELFFHQLSPFIIPSFKQMKERTKSPNKKALILPIRCETQVPTSAWQGLETVRSFKIPFWWFLTEIPQLCTCFSMFFQCLFSVLNWGEEKTTSLFHPSEDLSDSLSPFVHPYLCEVFWLAERLQHSLKSIQVLTEIQCSTC